MNYDRIQKLIESQQLPRYRARQLQDAFFRRHLAQYQDISTLAKDLRQQLTEAGPVLTGKPVTVLTAADGLAHKALLELGDGQRIETVLMRPKPDLLTACISSQVGCALGCRFCATGQRGFSRNLTSEEITDQVLFWRQFLAEKALDASLNNVVYMGMGEPFQNTEEVFASLDELMRPETFAMGARHLSVSTVGLISQIRVFTERYRQVNLAVSLHSANEELRRRLVPAAKANPLDKLAAAIANHLDVTHRKVFIEYILLRDVNDQPAAADELIRYLQGIQPTHLLHVNLIVYNDVGAEFRPVSSDAAKRFLGRLVAGGISATIRKSLGQDIAAACGQLAASGEAES